MSIILATFTPDAEDIFASCFISPGAASRQFTTHGARRCTLYQTDAPKAGTPSGFIVTALNGCDGAPSIMSFR